MHAINAGLVIGLAGTLSGALMSVLALAISRAPGWKELRSFALVTLAATAYCFFDLVHVVPVAERTLEVGEGLAMTATVLYGFAWMRHRAITDRRPHRGLDRAAVILCAVMLVLAYIPGVFVVEPVRSVHVAWCGATYRMATATPFSVACVAGTFVAILATTFRGGRRWRDGWHVRWPMIGAVTLVAAGITDTLGFLEIIPVPQMTEAATVVVVGAMGVSYARRFVADAQRLEQLSTKLEQEVTSRTHELLAAQAIAARHERLAGLGRMAAGVAHEINNPTMVIQQNLGRVRELLAEAGLLTAELAGRLERGHSATERIADIVRALLETGRQPAADQAPPKVFSLAAVVDKTLVAVSAAAPELRVAVSIDPALHASGNPSFVEQVLINLLVNAAHAAQGRTDAGHVRIVAIRAGERVRVSVADNGPGIPAAMRDRLFEPFATTKPVGQGTGLGLAVSRSLMTQQGGALFVASSTSAGTEMVVELPAADVAATNVPAAIAEGSIVLPAKRDLRVLVIDDNEDVRDVLLLQLDRFFHVDTAGTVDQALALAAGTHRYDVVLCDLMMPAGGAEAWLARCTSVDPRLADRTILVTGGPTNPAATELVERRREMVLYKPVDMATLRPMIERVAAA